MTFVTCRNLRNVRTLRSRRVVPLSPIFWGSWRVKKLGGKLQLKARTSTVRWIHLGKWDRERQRIASPRLRQVNDSLMIPRWDRTKKKWGASRRRVESLHLSTPGVGHELGDFMSQGHFQKHPYNANLVCPLYPNSSWRFLFLFLGPVVESVCGNVSPYARCRFWFHLSTIIAELKSLDPIFCRFHKSPHTICWWFLQQFQSQKPSLPERTSS